MKTSANKSSWVRAGLGHIRDLIILIIIGNIIGFLFNPHPDNLWLHIRIASLYSLFIGGTLWKGNQFIGWLVHRKIDSHKYPYKALLWSLVLMLVFSLIDIFIVNYIWFVWVFNRTISQFFQEGFITMVIDFGVTVIITSIFFASGFFQAWRESAVNEERLQKESIRLQYNALKNQVNPHFLFNSLNTLTTLVYKDADLAARFIKQLSEVYRYVLENKGTELVSLEEEISFCKKYIYLQQIRHGDSLKVDFNIAENHAIRVVPLSIQLLLENAIKHNEISEENPLQIVVETGEGSIIIRNNLQARKVIPESGGIGLDNLRQRYAFLSNKPLETRNDYGNFTVSIPLIKTEDL